MTIGVSLSAAVAKPQKGKGRWGGLIGGLFMTVRQLMQHSLVTDSPLLVGFDDKAPCFSLVHRLVRQSP